MRIKSILAKQKYIYSTHKRPRKLAVKMPFKITSTRYVDRSERVVVIPNYLIFPLNYQAP